MLTAAELDPFDLDWWFADRPVGERRTWELAAALYRAMAVPGLDTPPQALAALRDLDFLMCGFDRAQPGMWQVIPGLEERLLRLGKIADHIPRGDNQTYGRWNPDGPRKRTFTGTLEERELYRGLALGESRLDELLSQLTVCMITRIGSEMHAAAAGRLAELWEPMVDGIRLMHKARVAPVMGEQIAPWVSRTFTVGGQDFRGPTAAQKPVVLIDYLVHLAESDDPSYLAHYRYYGGEQSTPRKRRVEQAMAASKGRTLITQMADDLPRAMDPDCAKRSLEGVAALLRRMYGFRRSHAPLAWASLPVREKGDESWGTGAFDPRLIDWLIKKTAEARRRVTALTP